MRDQYKLQGTTENLTITVEKDVCEILKAMESQTKLSVSELANTALKRFISAHKDFLPADFKKPQKSA